jgi:hypothetical protein
MITKNQESNILNEKNKISSLHISNNSNSSHDNILRTSEVIDLSTNKASNETIIFGTREEVTSSMTAITIDHDDAVIRIDKDASEEARCHDDGDPPPNNNNQSTDIILVDSEDDYATITCKHLTKSQLQKEKKNADKLDTLQEKRNRKQVEEVQIEVCGRKINFFPFHYKDAIVSLDLMNNNSSNRDRQEFKCDYVMNEVPLLYRWELLSALVCTMRLVIIYSFFFYLMMMIFIILGCR